MIDTVQVGEEVEVFLQYHYMQLIGSLHYTTKRKKKKEKRRIFPINMENCTGHF